MVKYCRSTGFNIYLCWITNFVSFIRYCYWTHGKETEDFLWIFHWFWWGTTGAMKMISIIRCSEGFSSLHSWTRDRQNWILALEWWQKCAPSHGLVAKLAFKFLVSLETTVPCEWLYSLSGHVVNSKHVSGQHKQARLPQQLAEYGLSVTKDFTLEWIKLILV